MFKRIRREAGFLLSNISIIFLFSFLYALGGVLLWINGGSTWFAVQSYQSHNTSISLSGAFVLCLIIYALIGAVVSIILKVNGCMCSGKSNTLTAIILAMAMYILSLAWYAVFFCTRLSVFSSILLAIAIILGATLFFVTLKRMFFLSLGIVLVELLQIYFLYVNISFYLSN